jgi:hypothetical protein
MAVYSSTLSKQEAVASDVSKTLIQLRAGRNGPAKVIEWGVSFDGTSSTATPARVKLIRQTTSGTMTLVGPGIQWDSVTTGSSASYRIAASSEPTGTADVYEIHQVTPTGGLLLKQYPLGRELVMQAGERLGMVVTAGASSAASALGYIVWEE